METRTLQVILEHCFPPARLKRIMPKKPAGRDWYEAAADEILNETDIGIELSSALDTESRPQQTKIRSMKVSELRDNLSLEFLEPGKTFALILWALMSDERLSARNLADQLSQQFCGSENDTTSDTEEESMNEMDSEDIEIVDTLDEEIENPVELELDDIFDEEIENPPLRQTVTLDQQIAEFDEKVEDDVDDVDDLDLDALLEEIRDEESFADEDEGEDDLDQLFSELDETQPTAEVEIESEPEFDIESEPESESEISSPSLVQPIEINDQLLDEVDQFIASLDEGGLQSEEESDEEESDSIDEMETESLMEEIDFGEAESESDSELDSDILDIDILDDDLSEEDEIEEIEEMEDFDEEELVVSPVVKEENEMHLPVPTVQLGGITISLYSLKRACESVFKEPVELVTDENLTQQDQIVVVGRQCGVRILHGPTWTQPIEPYREISGESITINPSSLQLALSRIYQEPVELIPDPKLLLNGMILFAGKTTGLEIMENLRTRVPLPEWAEGVIESEEPEGSESPDLLFEIADLREQIAMLHSRIESLEQAPPPEPIYIEKEPIQAVKSTPEPEPTLQLQEPEPEMEEPEFESDEIESLNEEIVLDEEIEPEVDLGHIEDTPISVEDIESEELEPIVEIQLDDEELNEDVLDEDLIASISMEEDTESGGELGELGGIGELGEDESSDESGMGEIDLGEIDLDELNLDEISDDSLDESLLLDTEEDSIASLGDGLGEVLGDGLGELEEVESDEMGEIDLSALGLDDEEETSLPEETGLGVLEDDELSEDEISLDELDLNSFEDYVSEEDDEGLGEKDEGESDDSDDVDLSDILSELDMDDDDSEAAPEVVFSGETILLLGGETKNRKEYQRVVEEIGGNCLWYANLSEMPEGEIAELVDQSDLVMTLSADAISDPGILQATNYAEEQQKPLVQHHSSNPVSVQKQLIKIMQEEE